MTLLIRRFALRILIVGSGGREHALAWKVALSRQCQGVWICPGNAGTATVGTNLSDISATDFNGIIGAVKKYDIDLVVIGPEDALSEGLTDLLIKIGIPVIGPPAVKAKLESSKQFCKTFLNRHNIPTAFSKLINNSTDLEKALNSESAMTVLKMDGLAQGKGVFLSSDKHELLNFGLKALNQGPVLMEEFLSGDELSCFLVMDGKNVKLLPLVSDYKRAFNDNLGPNSGGMGAVCPVPLKEKNLLGRISDNIIKPIERGLKNDSLNYIGILFIGLIYTKTGPKVLEFNVRFGDPETQALLPLLQTDIIDVFESMTTGCLNQQEICFHNISSVSVVVASAGYPDAYDKHKVVTKLPPLESDLGILFHSNTIEKNRNIITGGGRSFTVTGIGKNLAKAKINAYRLVEQVKFDGAWSRSDIASNFSV